MTNIEAIIEDLLPLPISRKLATRKCLKYGIEPAGSITDEKAIAVIEVEILSQMLKLSGVSEGGVSHSYSIDGIKDQIKSICLNNGLDYKKYMDVPTVSYLEDF